MPLARNQSLEDFEQTDQSHLQAPQFTVKVGQDKLGLPPEMLVNTALSAGLYSNAGGAQCHFEGRHSRELADAAEQTHQHLIEATNRLEGLGNVGPTAAAAHAQVNALVADMNRREEYQERQKEEESYTFAQCWQRASSAVVIAAQQILLNVGLLNTVAIGVIHAKPIMACAAIVGTCYFAKKAWDRADWEYFEADRSKGKDIPEIEDGRTIYLKFVGGADWTDSLKWAVKKICVVLTGAVDTLKAGYHFTKSMNNEIMLEHYAGLNRPLLPGEKANASKANQDERDWTNFMRSR